MTSYVACGVLVGLLLVLTACNTSTPTKASRPANDNNYETDFRYPELTEHYALQEKIIYPDPGYGVMLRYIDRRMYNDQITVYVYPVNALDWSEPDELLAEHREQVLAEIQQAVAMGLYLSSTPAQLSDFMVDHEGKVFRGKKARLQLVLPNGSAMDSDTYLFIGEDKFIKFRISFDAGFTPDMSGDDIVRELLPGIVPPPESEFMREVRESHRQRVADTLLKVLLENSRGKREATSD